MPRRGLTLAGGPEAEARLKASRKQYEHFPIGLAESLRMALPPWLSDPEALDYWKTSAWRNDSHL